MYPYKDHLGNIRINYAWDEEANELTVLNEHHYYPFGLEHAAYNTTKREFKRGESNNHPVLIEPVENAGYQYKYNGKELQDELGLNMYDLGARGYDPARVQFGSIDPRAEEYYSQSPYVFATNNPVYFVDINGEGVDDHYELNTETKELKKVKETDDDFDVIYSGKEENGEFVRDGDNTVVEDTNVLDREMGDVDFSEEGLVFDVDGNIQNAIDVTNWISKKTNTELGGYGFKVEGNDKNGLFVMPWKTNNNLSSFNYLKAFEDGHKTPNVLKVGRKFEALGAKKTFHFHTHQMQYSFGNPSPDDWRNSKKRTISSYIFTRTEIWNYKKKNDNSKTFRLAKLSELKYHK